MNLLVEATERHKDDSEELSSSEPHDFRDENSDRNDSPTGEYIVMGNMSAPLTKKYKYRADRHYNSKWTVEEDHNLLMIVNAHGARNWKNIAGILGGDRTDVQCLHRYNKVLKPGLQKGAWTELEDAIVRREVMLYGSAKVKWALIADKLPGRLGKQCRERWFNHLDPSINRGDWNNSENRILYEAQKIFGNRWCEFMKILPGRTENSIKNRWHGGPMKRWLADNKLVSSAEGADRVVLTADNVVKEIKKFRETLARFNIRVDLKALLSLFSIESDPTTGLEFYYDGRPLPYKLQDHFDPSEVQTVIESNVHAVKSEAEINQKHKNENHLSTKRSISNSTFSADTSLETSYNLPHSDSGGSGIKYLIASSARNDRDRPRLANNSSSISSAAAHFNGNNNNFTGGTKAMSTDEFNAMMSAQAQTKHTPSMNMQFGFSTNSSPTGGFIPSHTNINQGQMTSGLSNNPNTTFMHPNMQYMLMMANPSLFVNSPQNGNSCVANSSPPVPSQLSCNLNQMTQLASMYPYNNPNGMNLHLMMMYQQQLQNSTASNSNESNGINPNLSNPMAFMQHMNQVNQMGQIGQVDQMNHYQNIMPFNLPQQNSNSMQEQMTNVALYQQYQLALQQNILQNQSTRSDNSLAPGSATFMSSQPNNQSNSNINNNDNDISCSSGNNLVPGVEVQSGMRSLVPNHLRPPTININVQKYNSGSVVSNTSTTVGSTDNNNDNTDSKYSNNQSGGYMSNLSIHNPGVKLLESSIYSPIDDESTQKLVDILSLLKSSPSPQSQSQPSFWETKSDSPKSIKSQKSAKSPKSPFESKQAVKPKTKRSNSNGLNAEPNAKYTRTGNSASADKIADLAMTKESPSSRLTVQPLQSKVGSAFHRPDSNIDSLEGTLSGDPTHNVNVDSICNTDAYKFMLSSIHNSIRISVQQSPIIDQRVCDGPVTEEVPLQAFAHFKYLNERSQRNLIEKLVATLIQSESNLCDPGFPNPQISTCMFADEQLLGQGMEEKTSTVNGFDYEAIAETATTLATQVTTGAIPIESFTFFLENNFREANQQTSLSAQSSPYRSFAFTPLSNFGSGYL